MKRIFVLLSVFLCAVSACAAEIVFEANVDRNKVALGDSVQLKLTFHNTQNVSALKLSDISGMQTRYLGPSTSFSIVNGKTSSSITHNYLLVPLKTGNFSLGPFSVEIGGKKYSSGVIVLEVLDRSSPVPSQENLSGDNSGAELSDRIFAVIQVDKRSVYLNEEVEMRIKLYINGLAVRDLEYPEFNHDGLSVSDYDKPLRYRQNINGLLFEVVEFKTRVSGLRQGEFKLGPARIKCNLLLKEQRKRKMPGMLDDFFGDDFFNDFFGAQRQVPHQLNTVAVPLTVLPLPDENKPDAFSGAIGDFKMNVDVSPKEVSAGDPITLRVSISGQGSFNTVTSFVIYDQQNFKVYDAQNSFKDGVKTFEQVLIPKSAEVKEVPPVKFSYFNPNSAEYRTLSSEAIPIKVNPALTAPKMVDSPFTSPVAERTAEREVLGRDIIYIKDSLGGIGSKGGLLYKNVLFAAVNLCAVIIYMTLFFFRRRQERLKNDPRYARLLRASKKARRSVSRCRLFLETGKLSEFYDSIFLLMQEYISDKFHLPKGGITAEVAEDLLRSKGADEGIISDLVDIFHLCDTARFSPAGLKKEGMRDTLNKVETVIEYLQRKRF